MSKARNNEKGATCSEEPQCCHSDTEVERLLGGKSSKLKEHNGVLMKVEALMVSKYLKTSCRAFKFLQMGEITRRGSE